MDRTIKLGIAALTLTVVAGCAGDSTAPEVMQGPAVPPLSADLRLALELVGLGGASALDYGGHLIVAGDIRVSRAQLDAALKAFREANHDGRPVQYSTTNYVTSPGKIQTIKVDLAAITPYPGWYNAAVAALAEWNAVPDSYVRFVQGTPADISIVPVPDNTGLAGYASWPENGSPGDTVNLNTNFGPPGGATHLVLLRNVVHELGHTIGFRHTNWNQVDSATVWQSCMSPNGDAGTLGAVRLTGTPTSGNDAASVMNGCTAGQSWSGFSTWDKYSVKLLYPIPAPTGGSVTYGGGVPTLSWQPVVGATEYRIQYGFEAWFTSIEFGQYYTSGGNGLAGTTSSTSFTDYLESFNGSTGWCYYYHEYWNFSEDENRHYYYVVEAVFPNGVSRAVVEAQVFECPES